MADVFTDGHNIAAWLQVSLGQNTVQSYLQFILAFLAVWLAVHFLHRYALGGLGRWLSRKSTLESGFVDVLVRAINPRLFPLIALSLALRPLNVAPTVDKVLTFVVFAALLIQFIVIASNVMSYVVLGRSRAQEGDPNLVNVKRNLLILAKAALWVGSIVFLLDNWGINVSTVIAGLGIGGIAVALAVQNIFGDAFNSFSLAIDKPFEIGDTIQVDSMVGTVEYLGLKTTRVRSPSGELIIFSNSDLTRSRILNFRRAQQRRVTLKVNLPPIASSALQTVPDVLKKAVATVAHAKFDTAYLAEFAESAIVFKLSYDVPIGAGPGLLATQHEVNQAVYTALEREQIPISFQEKRS